MRKRNFKMACLVLAVMMVFAAIPVVAVEEVAEIECEIINAIIPIWDENGEFAGVEIVSSCSHFHGIWVRTAHIPRVGGGSCEGRFRLECRACGFRGSEQRGTSVPCGAAWWCHSATW